LMPAWPDRLMRPVRRLPLTALARTVLGMARRTWPPTARQTPTTTCFRSIERGAP
jgi:hypothetical protein